MVKAPGSNALSANMFAYCTNNPVNHSDSTGQWSGAGRNSMSAVFSSGLTKLNNETASRMSAKVFCKGFVSGFVADLGTVGFYGVTNAIAERINKFIGENNIVNEAIYWCAS